MKVAVQFFVVFTILATAYSASSTWGERNSTDTVILNKNVVYPALANRNQTVYFEIPQSFYSLFQYQTNSKVISIIYLQDQFKNSSGPVNTLLWGGPGLTYATIQMQTQSSVGLNVTFRVYGK
ncbi:uncharacterized protein LOC128865774 isoform X1 [Anastrepha ludens]|uniref:uncharacterized protein LOC128865774 isoform X1 n=1 Tax=Anastrepha ludens TaxID=28586 RepID=UPI0023AFD8CE|nr:uncharacterized protein LOC128865774 isoform X1 [Anastrepha ludens]